MSRKIRSDVPRPRLLEELKKEFAVYSDRFHAWFKKLAERYPVELFITMVSTMVLSIVFAFFINTHPPQGKAGNSGKTARAPRSADISNYPGRSVDSHLKRILSNTQAIAEIRELDAQLQLILKKNSVTQTDSLAFFTISGRLDSIRKHLLNQ